MTTQKDPDFLAAICNSYYRSIRPVGGKLIRHVNLARMALAYQLAALLFLCSVTAFAGEGMTLQEYYRMNNIDPAAKAFVRVTQESVPQGCPRRATAMFRAEAREWTHLHESALRQEPPAFPDGHVTFQGRLLGGRVRDVMISSESVGTAALFTRVENRIRTIRYGKGCQGAFSVTVLFHQPSVPQ